MILVKVPAINGLGKTKGCEKAPDLVLESLKEIWSNESDKELMYFAKEIKIDNLNPSSSSETILNESKAMFEKENQKIIFLGGDHSISFPLMKSFSAHFKNAGLIVLDAHADCMLPTKEKEITHEGWLRALIERGFDAKNIFLVGSRNNDPEENKFLREKKVNLFSANEFEENIQEACEALMEKAKDFDSLYLSIDIDVADPAFAPGTGYCEPGGLTSRQLIYLVQKLNLLKNLKAIDLVEANPEKDLNNLTVKLASKLIAELA
jgi:agmatinase